MLAKAVKQRRICHRVLFVESCLKHGQMSRIALCSLCSSNVDGRQAGAASVMPNLMHIITRRFLWQLHQWSSHLLLRPLPHRQCSAVHASKLLQQHLCHAKENIEICWGWWGVQVSLLLMRASMANTLTMKRFVIARSSEVSIPANMPLHLSSRMQSAVLLRFKGQASCVYESSCRLCIPAVKSGKKTPQSEHHSQRALAPPPHWVQIAMAESLQSQKTRF